ncbi:MAG: PHP domain-containing protein [Candidatus Krumholzibacteriota bacterium]
MYSDCHEGPLPDPKGKFTLDEVTDLGPSNGGDLVRPCDIKGILHSHSRWTDGAHSLDSMVSTAREIGLEYLGISDHFLSENHQEGLDLSAAMIQREEVDRLLEKYSDFDVLQGIEVDVNPDGTLPVDDETLGYFDFVIASFPENGGYDRGQLLEQVILAARHPKVTILGTPVGDFMLLGCNGSAEMEQVLKAAAEGGTAVEISANPNCKELDWTCCQKAQELGVYMAISPNAHRAARLVDFRHGAEMAQAAGVTRGSILNTLTSGQLRNYLANGVGKSK